MRILSMAQGRAIQALLLTLGLFAMVVDGHKAVEAQDLTTPSSMSDGEKVAFAELVGRKIFDTKRAREAAKAEFDSYRVGRDDFSFPDGTWVVTPFGTNWKAALVDSGAAGEPLVRFQLQLTKTGEILAETVEASPDGVAPDEFQVSTYRALETAGQVTYRACSQNREIIAVDDMSPDGSGGYSVYLLAVPDDKFVYQLGRHYRVQVDKTGKKLLGVNKISDSCFQIRPGDGFDPTRPELSTYLVRHSDKTAPDEVDVYLNLTMQLPLVIYTTPSYTTWNLEGGEIEIFGW